MIRRSGAGQSSREELIEAAQERPAWLSVQDQRTMRPAMYVSTYAITHIFIVLCCLL